jgi:nucleoid-associated protein YgaU
MKKYSVKPGDTLFKLAQSEYGDGALFTVIAAQNHLANPDLITVGQELLVPYVTLRHLVTADQVLPSQRDKITQKYYGTTARNRTEVWEKASGVLQMPVYQGTWLLIPDLANAGHHAVVDNESLAGLAGRWYGDDGLGFMIARANDLDPTAELTDGQVLQRPLLNYRRIVMGDTLEVMCREVYGDHDLATRMAVVVAANNIKDPGKNIKDPGKLFSNQGVYFPDM